MSQGSIADPQASRPGTFLESVESDGPTSPASRARRWANDGFPWTTASDLSATLNEVVTAAAPEVLLEFLHHLAGEAQTMASLVLIAVARTLAESPGVAFDDPRTSSLWRHAWAAFDRLPLPLSLPMEEFVGVRSPLAYLASYPDGLGLGPTLTYLEVLIRYGADVHHGGPPFERQGRTVQPFTPLHVAVLVRNPDAVATLLDHGADPYRPAGLQGDTPLDLMVREHHRAMEQLVVAREQRLVRDVLTDHDDRSRPRVRL